MLIDRISAHCFLILGGHEAADVTSSLSTDGVLTVTAPKKVLLPPVNERIVSVTQTDEIFKDKNSNNKHQEKN